MMQFFHNVIRTLVLVLLSQIMQVPFVLADDLGRLFFTPDERRELDRLRSQKNQPKPGQEIVVDIEPEAEPEPETVVPDIGGITVNGLVYRKGGKSTAWVNNANSYEGDLTNRYIRIDANNIKPEDVEIIIPSREKKLKLRVGEIYEPDSGETIGPEYHPK